MINNKLSHAYIISSLSEEERMAAALSMASTILCNNDLKRPCGVCQHCRKVSAGIHPDVIFVSKDVDDKGKQRREIYVDQIRHIIADAQILPNEAEKKVYIISDAGSMNTSAQNAILKVLEEPPTAAVFILCTDSAGLLLDTVRSRCVEVTINSEGKPCDDDSLALARQYINCVAKGKQTELLRFLTSNEGMDAAKARKFISCTQQLLTDILCKREANPGLDRTCVSSMFSLMAKMDNYLNMNVSVKHVFGVLAVNDYKV